MKIGAQVSCYLTSWDDIRAQISDTPDGSVVYAQVTCALDAMEEERGHLEAEECAGTIAGWRLVPDAKQVNAALEAGCEPRELAEEILQTFLFAGFPAAVNGMKVASRVFAERGLTVAGDGD